MKKFLLLLSLVSLVGCASIPIPNYIPDNNPYKKQFYGKFEDVLNATAKTLEEYGWNITETSDPAVYERKSVDEAQRKQIVLFTQLRETPMFLGTRYLRINAFVRSAADNSVEVELRYVTVTSVPLKTFYSYHKESLIKKMLKSIEQKL